VKPSLRPNESSQCWRPRGYLSSRPDHRVLTNSSMMQVRFLPGTLIILGGSYIGLEFGQMFRRFGSEVTSRNWSEATQRLQVQPSGTSSRGRDRSP
jgi:hypothetical protein